MGIVIKIYSLPGVSRPIEKGNEKCSSVVDNDKTRKILVILEWLVNSKKINKYKNSLIYSLTFIFDGLMFLFTSFKC